jgi:proteasome alpha subunit
MARLEAQKHKITYGEDAPVEVVARHLTDVMQLYTQYGGIRPFGVSFLLAGIDSEPRLFEAEPSGALSGYKAAAVGAGKKEVEEIFEKEYRPGLAIDDGIALALRALKKTSEQKLKTENADIAVITTDERKFEILKDSEVEKYLAKA